MTIYIKDSLINRALYHMYDKFVMIRITCMFDHTVVVINGICDYCMVTMSVSVCIASNLCCTVIFRGHKIFDMSDIVFGILCTLGSSSGYHCVCLPYMLECVQ